MHRSFGKKSVISRIYLQLVRNPCLFPFQFLIPLREWQDHTRYFVRQISRRPTLNYMGSSISFSPHSTPPHLSSIRTDERIMVTHHLFDRTAQQHPRYNRPSQLRFVQMFRLKTHQAVTPGSNYHRRSSHHPHPCVVSASNGHVGVVGVVSCPNRGHDSNSPSLPRTCPIPHRWYHHVAHHPYNNRARQYLIQCCSCH